MKIELRPSPCRCVVCEYGGCHEMYPGYVVYVTEPEVHRLPADLCLKHAKETMLRSAEEMKKMKSADVVLAVVKTGNLNLN